MNSPDKTQEKNWLLKSSFVVWLASWLFLFVVVAPAKERLPDFVAPVWMATLAVSSWIYFTTYARSKGYSYIVGIGCMLLNVIGAVVLAFLPNKNLAQRNLAEMPNDLTKSKTRKFITAYVGIAIFCTMFVAFLAEAAPSPFYIPFPTMPSLLMAIISAAFVWAVPWPECLSGRRFQTKVSEGVRRLCIVVSGVFTGAWLLYFLIAVKANVSTVFVLFLVPFAFLVFLNVLVWLTSWVIEGFNKPSKE